MKNSTTKKQLREFGLLIGIMFPIIIGIIMPLIIGHNFRIWTFWVAIPFLLIAILSPRSLFYPYKTWMMLGNALGWINSKLILGLVFLLVLQPIAIIMKITGYDPLRLKKINVNSYKENKKHHKINLNKIF